MILNLSEAPDSPIERLMWLSGVKEQVTKELNDEFAAAYYEARLQKQMETALTLSIHSRKRALALVRAENERRGRMMRWGDGLDPTSTAYSG